MDASHDMDPSHDMTARSAAHPTPALVLLLQTMAIGPGRRRGTRHGATVSERGASLVEYALLVALIAVVMAGAVTFLGDTTGASLDRSGSSILDATS